MRITLIAVCLLLGGCGSKNDNPKVRIGNAGTGLQMWSLPLSMANTLGYYKEEGVDVELENLGSSPKMMQALLGGSIDVAGLGYI